MDKLSTEPAEYLSVLNPIPRNVEAHRYQADSTGDQVRYRPTLSPTREASIFSQSSSIRSSRSIRSSHSSDSKCIYTMEFAQSREDDDLFADEFEAVPESIAAEGSSDVGGNNSSGVTSRVPEPHELGRIQASGRGNPVHGQNHHSLEERGRGKGQAGPGGQRRGEGRGRGRRDRGQRREAGGQEGGQGGVRQGVRGGDGGEHSQHEKGLGASQYATKSLEVQATIPTNSTHSEAPTNNPTNMTTATIQEPSEPSSVPRRSTPPIEQPLRTQAVRGDRSATGGPAHKKLTEEELTDKMAKMAIINAQKVERHKLAEADQAAFSHRERELAKERKEKAVAEKRNERAMEMERAKNRERKMKAQGVREWDSEKVESDIVDRTKGRSSEYVRGGHGGVMRGGGGLGTSRYATEDAGESETQQYRGDRRGRGGRGRGGTRGGKPSTPSVPKAEDFPSLPSALKTTAQSTTLEAPSTTPAETPAAEKHHDWAEEMATPIVDVASSDHRW